MKRLSLLLGVLFFSTPLLAQSMLENILSPSHLPFLKQSKLVQISSHDRTHGNSDFIAVRNGGTSTLADVSGPGVVVRIWVTIASNDPYFLRRILLRMTWDGEPSPSVEVPIGDFFGTGFQYKQYVTPYLGMSSGGYYCFFPMPFHKSAHIEVVNQTGRDIQSLYYHIDYHQLEQDFGQDVGLFHTAWRRDVRTDKKENYTILEAEGEGHLVGVNLNMQNHTQGLEFLEGDEMVYVDGESYPSVYGTGTEDYFTSGWYFNKGEYASPYHGLVLKDDSLSRIAAYRFHILDAIPFKRSIRFTIEHGHGNTVVADYSSTAYWYQKEPHKRFSPMLRPELRIPLRSVLPQHPLEAESLRVESSTISADVEEMQRFGADWSGMRQLTISGKTIGDSFILNLPVDEQRNSISIYSTHGPEYGNYEIRYGEKKVGELRSFSSEVKPGGITVIPDIITTTKTIPLRFILTGKDPKSSGYALGLDAFVIEPVKSYIPAWYLIGPFSNPRDSSMTRLGLDIQYPPEKEIRIAQRYRGVNEQIVGWKLEKTPKSGRMDLYMFNPYESVVVYALTYVYSPVDQSVPLLLGSDDGAKVFLNGTEIFRLLEIRVAQPDQNRILMKLNKGWNTLLLKVENNYGGYNFYARIPNNNYGIRINPLRQ
ncbi:MAG: glycoside hydrolase family 172 protein [bacterium]